MYLAKMSSMSPSITSVNGSGRSAKYSSIARFKFSLSSGEISGLFSPSTDGLNFSGTSFLVSYSIKDFLFFGLKNFLFFFPLKHGSLQRRAGEPMFL